jgi:hypothetical protein
VLSAPGLPTQLYREELVTGLVALVKYHLQYNLLVLYDVKYRRMYRPSSMSLDDGDGAVGGEGGGLRAGAWGRRPRRMAPPAWRSAEGAAMRLGARPR